MDSVGQLRRKLTWGFDGKSIMTDKGYDSRGRLESEWQPRFDTAAAEFARTFEYDDLNRIVNTNSYDDISPTTGYSTRTDYTGFTQTHTNPKSQKRTDLRDVLGRVQRTTDAANKNTDFSYDVFGNLTQTIDPNTNVIKVEYDKLGRKTRLTDPNLGRIDYFIDARSLLWRQQSPKQRAAAQFTTTQYDLLGRMISRLEPDLESRWEFDSAATGKGQLAETYTLTGPANNKTKDYRRLHAYDNLGRPSTISQTLGEAIGTTVYTHQSEYDDWGRVITETYQRGSDPAKVFQARYNAYGYLAQWQRPASITPTAIPAIVLWRIAQQSAAQQPIVSRFGNNLTEIRDYDTRANRLRGMVIRNVVLTNRVTDNYTFDAIGNVNNRNVTWETGGFSELFAYDELNRLKTSQVSGKASQSFAYDAVGNMTQKTGVGAGTVNTVIYPAQGPAAIRTNALVRVTGAAGTFGAGIYTYDDNGNLATAPNSGTASWTSFDMPLTLAKVNSGITSTASFTYGPEHHHARQITRTRLAEALRDIGT